MSRWDESDRSDEHAWSSLLNLSGLIDGTDSVSEALFGLSKRLLSGTKPGFSPLAHQRGWPPNPSAEVRSDMNEVAAMEAQVGKSEFCGATYIDLHKILAADLSALGVTDLAESDWHAVFEAVENFRKCDRLPNAGFRIVCWATW
jgi:hypothetical protein